MAHGFVSYSKPNLGNFGKYLGDKIKSAAKMAGEERKFAKEEAEKQRKSGVPEEEIKKPGKGYFFGKALSHEFGGDLLRRTKGTFSTDPSKENDPSLSKSQRFSALVRGDVVTPDPYKQLELPLNTGDSKKDIEVEDKTLKSWLTVAFDKIQQSYDNIATKIGGLKSEEDKQVDQETKTTKTITKIFSGLQTVKSFFNKNNKLQKEENNIESEQLELDLDSQNSQEMQQRESDIERGKDLSSTIDYSDPYSAGDDEEDESGNDRNLLDRIIDFGMDRNGRFRRKGFKRRYARRKFNAARRGAGRRLRGAGRRFAGLRGLTTKRFGGRKPRVSLSEGGVVPTESPSVSPESSFIKNSTDKSKTINQNNTTNNKVTKLAAGGIVDNPTKTVLKPGQSVIPLNRNNPVKNMFRKQKPNPNKKDASGKTMGEQLGKALQLPAQAAGGLLLSTLTSVFKRLGGIGQAFAPFLTQFFKPLATVFGLPATVVGSLLGAGPASAATMDMKGMADFLKGGSGRKKGGKKGGGGTPPPPGNGFGPGMTATGGSTASGYITSGFGQRNTGIAGASTNHGGIDISGGPWQQGAPISVIKPGVVEAVGDHGSSSWGKHVVVKHDDGSYSLYGHLSEVNVRKGQKINNQSGAATVIGKLGSTGVSSGPHLHFELGTGWNGTITGKIDPAPYVDNYIRGGGNVTVDATQVTAGNTPSPSPSGAPVSPGRSNTPASTAANNIFLGGSNRRSQPSAPSSISPIGSQSGLSIFTINPVAPTYYSPW